MQLSKEHLKDIIQWDIKTWSKALAFWNITEDKVKGKKVLAIGERGGGLSLYFALQGASVVCTDYNSFPEETRKLHERHNVLDQISYLEGVDASNLHQFEDESIDIVVFKSVIGALSSKEKQKAAMDEFARVLKKGGSLYFAENMEGSAVHRFFRKKFVRWASYWRYLDLTTDLDLFDKYSKKKFKMVGFLSGFGRSEGQRQLLAGIDTVTLPLTPKTWRTVLIGVLKK